MVSWQLWFWISSTMTVENRISVWGQETGLEDLMVRIVNMPSDN